MNKLSRKKLDHYVSLARSILSDIAQGKRDTRFICYEDLMFEMGGPGRGYIAQVLDEVSSQEYQNGRPLLSALVIRKRALTPGHGFWYISCLPDSVGDFSNTKKIAFWQQECERVRNYWRTHCA